MAWTRFTKKKDMPGGLWIKCEGCGSMLFRKESEARHRVCASCGYHFTLPGRDRIELTADEGSFEELHTNLLAEDRLDFVDRQPYADKLVSTRQKTGEGDAAIVGNARILPADVVSIINGDGSISTTTIPSKGTPTTTPAVEPTTPSGSGNGGGAPSSLLTP